MRDFSPAMYFAGSAAARSRAFSFIRSLVGQEGVGAARLAHAAGGEELADALPGLGRADEALADRRLEGRRAGGGRLAPGEPERPRLLAGPRRRRGRAGPGARSRRLPRRREASAGNSWRKRSHWPAAPSAFSQSRRSGSARGVSAWRCRKARTRRRIGLVDGEREGPVGRIRLEGVAGEAPLPVLERLQRRGAGRPRARRGGRRRWRAPAKARRGPARRRGRGRRGGAEVASGGARSPGDYIPR